MRGDKYNDDKYLKQYRVHILNSVQDGKFQVLEAVEWKGGWTK